LGLVKKRYGLTDRQDPSDDQKEHLELYACGRSPLIVHGKGIRDQAINVPSSEQREDVARGE
jgi:hypothetical protein